jgi:hypothetical protein
MMLTTVHIKLQKYGYENYREIVSRFQELEMMLWSIKEQTNRDKMWNKIQRYKHYKKLTQISSKVIWTCVKFE